MASVTSYLIKPQTLFNFTPSLSYRGAATFQLTSVSMILTFQRFCYTTRAEIITLEQLKE